MIVVLSAYVISTSNVFCKAFQNWRANKPNKLKIDYRLFVGLHLVYRCLFIPRIPDPQGKGESLARPRQLWPHVDTSCRFEFDGVTASM